MLQKGLPWLGNDQFLSATYRQDYDESSRFTGKGHRVKDTKLIGILKTLTKVELNHFGELVTSPYFNKNQSVSRLYETLAGLYPKFSDEDVDRHEVFRKLFPGSKFDEQKLRYASSDLVKLLELFLMLQELDPKNPDALHMLYEALRKRGLDKYSEQIIETSAKTLTAHPLEDMAFFLQRYQNEIDRYNQVSGRRNIAIRENLESLLQSLDTFYIINKLKYSSEVINHMNVWAGDYKPLLLEEILTHLKSNPEQSPAVSIYYHILKTLTHSDEEHWYFDLKALLAEHVTRFSKGELNDMYIFARNYCAKRINKGDLRYLPEVLDLYKTLLRDEIIFQDGWLSQWDFKNIVSAALRLEEFEWAENFIRTFKPKLRPEHRDNAYTYNLALLNYHLGRYGKTLELLRDVEFTDVYYHLDCKSLLLKTYYETEATRPLLSLMDAFYIYLRRNRLISAYQKEGYSNFLKFFKKLMKVRFMDREAARKVREEIEATKAVANLSWLLKKVDEVGGRTVLK